VSGPAGPDDAGRQGRLWTRLGLRSRITLLFGLGAFVLSVTMGGLSYFTARHFLVSGRQNTSLQQAYRNAVVVRDQLPSTEDIDSLLHSLDAGVQSESLLSTGGSWYQSSLSIGEESLPVALRVLVRSGTAATQTVTVNGNPEILVGVPIPSVKADYFEVFDISDLAHTLRILALALAAGGLVTTVLGAVVGRSAATRSLRPLTAVSTVAVAVAGGRLDTRLPEAVGDPDLEGLTTSFNRMVDQLQERIEREARFTSDVSHELRSPLTTLSATLDVLESHADELPPRARQALGLLGEELRRFQRMVADLLEISRSDTGSADVALDEVDAGELVRRSVAVDRRRALVKAGEGAGAGEEAAPLEVVIDDRLDGVRLLVDKRRFERVMANLLENAALYGGGATRVTAEPGPDRADGHSTVRVGVEDGGPGVEPGERARIFERFYRGHVSGRRGAGAGTGLGLALVAEHVRLQGGAVWVEEAPGGGARFVIELPVETEEEAP